EWVHGCTRGKALPILPSRPLSHRPSIHVPVLPDEVVHWLAPSPGSVLVDGTMGGGGHTRLLAERVIPGGTVIAVDRDPDAVEAAQESLAGLPVVLAHASFAELPEVLAELEFPQVDGVLLDLGLSSDQLADSERGFSFDSTGPLDLRFDPTAGEPAWRLLGRLSAEHLADLIYQYGEEHYSRRIGRAVVERRRQGQPVRTAADLAALVRRCIPRRGHGDRIDPATRTFQALRIAVNDELKALDTALRRIPSCLRPGGRFAAISFHSLEDRRVKNAFRDAPHLNVLTKRPIRPTDDEIAGNARARSAKMRVAERLPPG
ncbi:MAG: 16S rRNA (cytosine(1402)-N(4))-methyltransferase RsmH, partial [Thermoguttaceae bacterium]